ncbi:hypothetical protein BDN72DRAFT_885594 [Pluteus cervinus]|uniref:Uncharacterized protein n=1 Tax=Pluteus cervinus TaxID=181527 RepID=A0ACD3BE41_9AGAR|nr:hypothetical protein BDN72DRAFT_885594 [Pluteus cervinus]
MAAEDDTGAKRVIRLKIPPRMYLVPGTAIIVGTVIGLVRGSRTTSLRFLAENVHRPPRTVQGWYFYNKTKNYKVLLGGLKGAGLEASKLGLVASGYVGIEEGLERMGWGEAKEVGAAVGTAGIFSAVYRLPWRMAGRTVVLGGIIGSTLKGLDWGRRRLEAQQNSGRASGAPETPEVCD